MSNINTTKSKRGKRNPYQRAKRKNKPKNQKPAKGQPLARSRKMQVHNTLSDMRLSHREYMFDVLGDTEAHFAINPGLGSTLPWLSTISCAFEMYNWNRLHFEFVPSVAATQAGVVALCPDFDPDDSDDNIVKRDLYQFEHTVRDSVWKGVDLRLNSRDLQRRKNLFIRAGETQFDTRLTDALHLWVVTTGIGNNDPVGELWVSYDITLCVPQISTDISLPQESVFKTSTGGPAEFGWLSNPAPTDTVTTEVTRAATAYPDTANGARYYFTEPGYYTVSVKADSTGMGLNSWIENITNGEILESEGHQDSVASTFDQILGLFFGPETTETNPGYLSWGGITADTLISIATEAVETALPILLNTFEHFLLTGLPATHVVQENGSKKFVPRHALKNEEEEESVQTSQRNYVQKVGRNEGRITHMCYYSEEFLKLFEAYKLRKERKSSKHFHRIQ